MTRVVYSVDIGAPVERVWAAAVDWRGQDRWVPMTTVRAGKQSGIAVGGEIAAYTGVGPVGFLDTMTITRWDTGRRVDVLHTGSFVRGIGILAVKPLGANRSRFYWAEDLDLPLGIVGQIGWQFLKPGLSVVMRSALGKFASLVEAGELGAQQGAPVPMA